MNKTTVLILFFGLSELMLAQTGEGLSNDLDKYRRVFFDDNIAYLDTESGEMISSAIYDSLILAESDEEIICFNGLDHWDSTQFHVYKNQPQFPMLINFTDLEFHPPVEGTQVVTSRFGKRSRGPHRGIDIDLVTGDDVMAVLPGVVRFVNYSRGHGRTVVIRHDNGMETVYAHLSEYGVKVNERVEKGQVIGQGGITGNARGSHLHFEVRYKGIAIHPEYIFDFENFTIADYAIYITRKWTNPLHHYSTRKSKIECICSIEDIEKELVKPRPDMNNAITELNSTNTSHVVQKGDTLYSLARKYNCSVDHLCKVNKISDPSRLKIGMSLRLQ